MNPVVIVAAIFLIVLLASLPLLKRFVDGYIVRKAQNTAIVHRDPLLEKLQPGKPAIIYFTSPGCGPCQTTQRPIIEKLRQERGDSPQILTLNIEDNMDATLRWVF